MFAGGWSEGTTPDKDVNGVRNVPLTTCVVGGPGGGGDLCTSRNSGFSLHFLFFFSSLTMENTKLNIRPMTVSINLTCSRSGQLCVKHVS